MPVKLKIFVHPNWEFWEHLLHTQKSWKFLCIQIENFGHFLHTEKIVLVKRIGNLQNKSFQKSCTKRLFQTSKGTDHPLIGAKTQKITEGHIFREKIAPPQKTKAFFSPLSKRGEFRELKKRQFWVDNHLPQFPLTFPKNSLSHKKGNLRYSACELRKKAALSVVV